MFFRRFIWGIVALALFCVLGQVPAAHAQTQVSSGDLDLTSTVIGPPPATAPTILQPTNGQTFTAKNITVSGTCIAGLIVKIFSSNIFVGSAQCQPGGTFSLPIDLFIDQNDLVARQYDLAGQSSPDSAVVTVYFLPPSDPATPTTPGESVANFLLTIDYDYTAKGVFVNKPFTLPVHFVGGQAPYTVTIDWGDGSVNNFVRQNTSEFIVDYSYSLPGLYQVIIKVTDSSGQQAYLQFVILVHGQVDSPSALGPFLAQITKPDWGNPVFIGWSLAMLVIGLALGWLLSGWIIRKKHKGDVVQPPDNVVS